MRKLRSLKYFPLIVAINLLIVAFTLRVADARVWHLTTKLLPEETLERVCAVDPAVRVQYIFRNVFGVDAVNGVSHVLTRGDNQREGHEDHDSERVMEPENWRIDLNVTVTN